MLDIITPKMNLSLNTVINGRKENIDEMTLGKSESEYSCVQFFVGLGKKSRSLFMELDAKATTSPYSTPAASAPTTPRRSNNQVSNVWPPPSPKEQVSIATGKSKKLV